MPIAVPDELERAVTDRVAAGQYPTPADVIGAALAALAEKERRDTRLAELRAELARGDADIAAGRVRPLDAAAIDDLNRRVAERLARDAGGEP